MTNMKRISISFPDDIDAKIYNLRKNEEYVKCSYSEIIRRLVRIGLKVEAKKQSQKGVR